MIINQTITTTTSTPNRNDKMKFKSFFKSNTNDPCKTYVGIMSLRAVYIIIIKSLHETIFVLRLFNVVDKRDIDRPRVYNADESFVSTIDRVTEREREERKEGKKMF